jgi:hypothetical protein
MGDRFIHSVITPLETPGADGVRTIDLPVNPLSVILLQINPLNETSTIGNFQDLFGLLSAIDLIEVLHRGQALFSMSGQDALAKAIFVDGLDVWPANRVSTDNDRVTFCLPILLGRRAYDPKECIPKTKKGELQLQITEDIADVGYDALRISVETIELPNASPEFLQRASVLTQTLAATGDNDQPIPIGPAIRGILAVGTTSYTGAVPAPTLGRLSVLKDNLQYGYSLTRFENSKQITMLRPGRRMPFWGHRHQFTDAAAGAVFTLREELLAGQLNAYTYLDFDPLADDTYLLETAGAGSITLRNNADVANAMRTIPIQKFPAASLQLS